MGVLQVIDKCDALYHLLCPVSRFAGIQALRQVSETRLARIGRIRAACVHLLIQEPAKYTSSVPTQGNPSWLECNGLHYSAESQMQPVLEFICRLHPMPQPVFSCVAASGDLAARSCSLGVQDILSFEFTLCVLRAAQVHLLHPPLSLSTGFDAGSDVKYYTQTRVTRERMYRDQARCVGGSLFSLPHSGTSYALLTPVLILAISSPGDRSHYLLHGCELLIVVRRAVRR